VTSVDIVRPLATGILHVPASEQRSGRLGLVGVLGEGGLTVLRGVPAWDVAVLVAVLQHRRALTMRHRFGPGRTVYMRIVETPVVLGRGRVHTATTGPSGLADLVGLEPADRAAVPWMDAVALARVNGQCVRLELHRPPQTRSGEGRCAESA
jgi:hypothetical protein